MSHYDLMLVRDDTLRMMDITQESAERNQQIEMREIERRGYNNLSLGEMQDFWHSEAKVAAQFAYMRRLVRTEGFVAHVMEDFNALDSNRSGRLDAKELEDYLRGHERGRLLMSNTANPPMNSRAFLADLDLDQDGYVSRAEWLTYVAYLHWQKNVSDTKVVERVIETLPEFDRRGSATGNIVKRERILERSGSSPPELVSAMSMVESQSSLAYNNRREATSNPVMLVQKSIQNPDGTVETVIEQVELDKARRRDCLCQ